MYYNDIRFYLEMEIWASGFEANDFQCPMKNYGISGCYEY